jgi:hypothetical protein
MLAPEACIRAHCAGAAHCDAELRFGVHAAAWQLTSAGVQVRVRGADDCSTTVEAGQLLLTGGAWMPDLVPELRQSRLLTPVRQVRL